MRGITFKPPNEPVVNNPPLEMLRKLILEAKEQYWHVGSGEGSVITQLGANRVALSLVLKEPYGFVLLYGMYDSTDDFVSINSYDFSTTVQASLGGNPWVVPTAFFVSRQKTWEAVKDFCRTGQMSNSLTWGRLAEQKWDDGNRAN